MIKKRPTVYEFISEWTDFKVELHLDYNNKTHTITNKKWDKNFIFTDKTSTETMCVVFDLIKEAKEFWDLVVSEMD